MVESLPGFRWWWPQHYASSVIQQYAFSSFSAPFAILGDFNKDGVVDAALHGHEKTRDLILVLLSVEKNFKVIEIEQDSSSWSPVWDIASKFLARVRPGKLTSPLETAPLVLVRAAFQVNQFGKNSSVYYFSKGSSSPTRWMDNLLHRAFS